MKLSSIPASISWVSSGFRSGLLRVVLSENPATDPNGNPVAGLNEGNVAYQLPSEI